jgi:DDE superfamily endonuclease
MHRIGVPRGRVPSGCPGPGVPGARPPLAARRAGEQRRAGELQVARRVGELRQLGYASGLCPSRSPLGAQRAPKPPANAACRIISASAHASFVLNNALCCCQLQPVRKHCIKQWIHRLTPVLNQALGFEQQLPAQRAAAGTQVLRACPGLEFIIDGAERPIQRPKDKQRQREYYSGKKKRHTVKNVTIGDRRTRKIKALSRTRPGKTSDKRTADEADYHFPARSKLWKATGFQGYEPPKVRTYQPKKKPRKGELTAAEKATNQAISRKRVRIEHRIGGAKVFHLARDVFRNRRDEDVDLSFETACGLHNLRCDYRLSAGA